MISSRVSKKVISVYGENIENVDLYKVPKYWFAGESYKEGTFSKEKDCGVKEVSKEELKKLMKGARVAILKGAKLSKKVIEDLGLLGIEKGAEVWATGWDSFQVICKENKYFVYGISIKS